MPHMILEYSDNLEFDVQDLFARLGDALIGTGVVRMKGLKGRTIRHTEYRIADGHEAYAFVHLSLLIREGRPREKQEEMAQVTMKVLEETFADRLANGYLSLTNDIKELEHGISLNTNNIPVDGLTEAAV